MYGNSGTHSPGSFGASSEHQTKFADTCSRFSERQQHVSKIRRGCIEVVEIAIMGYHVHRRALKQDWIGNHRVDYFTRSCKGPCLNRVVNIRSVRLNSQMICPL